MLEARLARRGAAGLLVGPALEHQRAERARDLGRPVGAAVGDDQHVVVLAPVRLDRVEAGADHQLLVVRRDQDQKTRLVAAVARRSR